MGLPRTGALYAVGVAKNCVCLPAEKSLTQAPYHYGGPRGLLWTGVVISGVMNNIRWWKYHS